MININTKNINSEIIGLNQLIEDYTTNYLNLFNTINQLQSSWVGPTAETYFEQIDQDKAKTTKMLNKIKDQNSIYKYIYDSYRKIGNSIKCNLNSKEELIKKVKSCIDKTTEILKIYQTIGVEKSYEERESIIKKKEKTKQILSKYKEIKENINNTYSKIEEIEQEVNIMINRFIEN